MTDKTNEKKQRLLSLLREMFQLDQPDLDFGLYRIMHAKRGQVEAFLETEFDQLIDKVFAGRGARQEDEARKVYEAAKQQAADFGAPDPDAAPTVQQARARYDAIRLTGGEDAEIYDHLYRFFSRYYDAGDFLSLRRYGKGAAGGAETYAIPYDGAEVVLHWANKDQYYIKTTENFSHFSFNPRQALEKDERGITRQLFDDADSAAPLQVHFRLVDAAEGAHNNVKAGDKDERFFVLDETPLEWQAPIVGLRDEAANPTYDGAELVIRLHYQPDPEKSGQKSKWQDKRNEQTVQTVLDALAIVGAGHAREDLAAEYRAVLAREVPKGKDKKQPLLARYLTRYTASNSMDYFIHKDLGGFLRRELDFYLKNEVLKLDDFVGTEDTDVQAGIAEARLKALQSALEKAQAIRLLSQRLIDFLAQLENFQKKLWLKKKFVVETQYCITLDRIPEKYYPEISANERQREEWIKLFAIDEIKEDLASPGYSVPLTVEFLKANPFLVLDTALFCELFKQAILEEIDGFDEPCNGLLLHSENFQALQLIREKLREQVDCIYIDPPYNTGSDGFRYKDAYPHASWLSMIDDRLRLAWSMASRDTALFVSLDDNEQAAFRQVADAAWGRENFIATVIWQKMFSPKNTARHFSEDHDFVLVYAKDGVHWMPRLLPRTAEMEARYTNPDNDSRGPWTSGDLSARNPYNDGRYPITCPSGRVIPGPPPGTYWRVSRSKFDELNKDGRVWWGENGDNIPRLKRFLSEVKQGLVPQTIWSYKEVGHTQEAKKELIACVSPNAEEVVFQTPKPTALLRRILALATVPDAPQWVVDFFAGSGTTAHAVIQQNREDNGQRRFALVEMEDYFDQLLLPRVKKASYAKEWAVGKPVTRDGVSHCFKYLRLESYEDCLNNLSLNPKGEAVAQVGNAELQRDYLLRYMLDVETQGSQSLLNIAEFRDPTAYQLEIKKPGSDERVKRPVDLVETFNWLIGLHVEKLHAGRYFTATFVRKPDPLLPEDAHTRLQVEALTPQSNPVELSRHTGMDRRYPDCMDASSPRHPWSLDSGIPCRNDEITCQDEEGKSWWFRPVEGYVRTVPGDDRHRQSVLVLWRSLTDDPEQDAAVLEAFLAQQMKFNPNRREDKTLYDVIYINGTHNLPKLGKYGEVRLLEEEFHRRMWAGEEV